MNLRIIALALLVGTSSAKHTQDEPSLRARRETENHCWPCSDEVCKSKLNACPETNPFVCLEGIAYSGCTAVEAIWLNPIDCTLCCDLSDCPTPAPTLTPIGAGASDPTSAPVEPTSAPIEPTSAPVEPTSAPIAAGVSEPISGKGKGKGGKGKGGKGKGKGSKGDGRRLAATNPSSRKATENHCWPCSDEVCDSDLNACPDTNPYVCVEGKAYSGCTAVESIWLNPEDCTSCCDLSGCPTPTLAPAILGASEPSGGKGKGKGKGSKSGERRGRRAYL